MANELFKTDDFKRAADQPVTCLGMEFPSDAARREYFTEELRKKLRDPEFRKIEGFPIGEDEDILALSDPPYYCACPNPWIGDFIKEWEGEKPPKDDLFHYAREPFAADVSEGKNDPIYNAHSYHTKVPHKAIMRYILHYTAPGDIVFDGFCGTGMTGVAAQMCGDAETVKSLGYRVDKDGNIYDPDAEDPTKPFSQLGARKAILNDLSPAATFIAYNYNTPVDVEEFEREAKRILTEVEEECGWMYETQHVDADGNPILGTDGKPIMGKINYVVWSDVFVCPNCMEEVVFYREAFDAVNAQVRNDFPCPHCGVRLSKNNMTRATYNTVNVDDGSIIQQAKQTPVVIRYVVPGMRGRFNKVPDQKDIALIDKICELKAQYFIPHNILPDGFNTRQPLQSHGCQNVNHFYTRRNLLTLSTFFHKCTLKHRLIFQSIAVTLCSRLVRYNMGNRGNGILNGTLYLPSLSAETEITKVAYGKVSDFIKAFLVKKHNIILCQSFEKISIPDNSMDYLFIDPPFGANINYSELNFIWEAWHQVFTNNTREAIVNEVQNKDVSDYKRLMTSCFEEAHRVLKPGRWMTVEFSNTSAAVWNNIQSALNDAGFIVANVSALDKKQGSFKAVTTPTAVKQDLIISAYKPNGGFEDRFITEVDSEEGVWDFVRTHLKYLPVAKIKGGKLVTVSERDPRLLFDQVVAYYVRKGYNVPISSQDFQEGLAQRFDERDGMYFLNSQVAEYDKKKATAEPTEHEDLFVSDEASAIAWLRRQLKQRTMTFQEINPLFMQELAGWSKHEVQLELSELLEQNFLCYDGKGEVPSQIHTYLSTNWHDLRDLAKDDPKLVAKAENRWYVPDPNKAGDLEKLRDKALLKEFEQYRAATKKLKTFRLEAVRAGFKHAYQNRDYATILSFGKRLPEAIIEEDPKLLMWYTQAELRAEG